MANICKINDIEYEYEYIFINSDGKEKSITSSAIRNLTIVDNFFNPFMRGSVAVANPYDLFEDGYILRGDGRDEFRVKLKPNVTVEVEDGVVVPELLETFILLKEENTGNLNVRSENIKIFKIVLKDSLPFMDTIPYGKKYQGKIGDIIKDIFIELLGEDRIDASNWESGDFEIEYFPPASYKYIDLIYHLLKFFYGKDGELYVKAIITRDSKTKKYSMPFISKMFLENNKNVTDVFTSADSFEKEALTNNSNNTPPDHDLKHFISGIKNFAYDTPLYEWNNDFFINYIVHGYDTSSGIHSMRILRLEDVEPKWITKFVDPFPTLRGKPKPFLVKNNKTPRKFRHYRTPYNIEDSVKMVEAEMYNILTFYNLNCNFSNLGYLERKSGKFIDIIKISDIEIDSDQKMFGRWFVTQVKHVFSNDGYNNSFNCCKTYVGPLNNINQNVD